MYQQLTLIGSHLIYISELACTCVNLLTRRTSAFQLSARCWGVWGFCDTVLIYCNIDDHDCYSLCRIQKGEIREFKRIENEFWMNSHKNGVGLVKTNMHNTIDLCEHTIKSTIDK